MSRRGRANILFVSHTGEFYGANRSVLATIDGLAVHGVQSCVIFPFGGILGEELDSRCIPSIKLPVPWWAEQRIRERNFLKGVSVKIQRVIQKERKRRLQASVLERASAWARSQAIDCVWTNSAVTELGSKLAKELNVPHVWHLREYVDLDFDLCFDQGRRATHKQISQAQLVIGVSQSIVTHYQCQCRPSKESHRYRAIWNPIDWMKNLRDRHVSRNRQKVRNFLIVGFVQEGKGQMQAVKAMASLAEDFPDMHLTIGGGGEIDALNLKIKQLGIEGNVEIAGYRKDPNPYYRSAECVLVCSRYEAFGRVTAEAMSFGLPVIGRASGGTQELIRQGETGLLYDGTTPDLAAKMRLILASPEEAQAIGRRAREFALAEFTIERQTERLMEALTDVGILKPLETPSDA